MADEGSRPRRRFKQPIGSIRVRTSAGATLVLGVSLVIAAVSMVILLQRSLRTNAQMTAFLRAEAIAESLAAGAGQDDLALGDRDDDEEFVQILDGRGAVSIASPNIAGLKVLAALDPLESRTIPPLNPPDVEPLDEPFIAVATAAAGPQGRLTVIVGRSLEAVGEATRALSRALLIAFPILLLIVGAVTWWVVGRALSPVDAIRAEVETISSKELYRRVPDPPGQDEISRLATTMNRMLQRLESGQRRERRFVSDASHELRSPVAVIRQHAEVAQEHPDTTTIGELAEIVLEEDARLQRVVDDLLLLTRIDEGTLHPKRDPVDLDDLMFEEAARLRGATDLQIDVRHVSAGRVSGDREQLVRLIRNLTDNAARHARSTVALSLHGEDGEVVIGIDDDGVGIVDPEPDRIFERFVRLDEARDRDSGGSGLGLAIVREVANLHGGTVVLGESRLGGATFEVRLPAHDEGYGDPDAKGRPHRQTDA